MFSKLPMFAVAAFLAYGAAQIVAAYLGIEYHWGPIAAGLLIGASFLFRFTLPITIGSFFGATDVWGWHWAVAGVFAVPGLLFLIPGTIISILDVAKRTLTNAASNVNGSSEPRAVEVSSHPKNISQPGTLVWILIVAVVGLLGVIAGMVISDERQAQQLPAQSFPTPASVVEPPPRSSAVPTVEEIERAASEEPVVNVYNWSDYIDPATLEQFTAETGIKVNYDVFDSNEVIETKLLAGKTGYDVVVPGAAFMERQIGAGVFQTLDRSKLPNWRNLDPLILQRAALHDPGNKYSVNHMWGTTGIGYDESKVKAIDPNAPVDSWDLVFDPKQIAKYADCGVSLLDAPTEMLKAVLAWKGKNPNSQNEADLKVAEEVLVAIRPYVRMIHSSSYIDALANGEICVAVGWSGDVLQSIYLAEEAGQGVTIKYSVPKEGTIIWFDMYAIPADAPHPNNAHAFINFMMKPEVAAANANFVNYATGNAAALKSVADSVRNDPGLYPPAEIKAKLFPDLAASDEFTRLINRSWTRITTGQ